MNTEFARDMSPWANFSLGFTYLSPVAGVYVLFAFALATAGPPMIWSFAIAGVGQLLVALIFGEVVSQFPLAGGVYPWARRLWGRKFAWMTGWIYLLALLVTIASVAYGAGPFVAAVLGLEPSTKLVILCALILLALATGINFAGTRVLSIAAMFGFAAELAGALVVGGWLLIFERHHGLGVLFDNFRPAGESSYFAAFAAAALIGIFQYYGFEACGDVAEEVKNPGRVIPQAMKRTIYIGGAAATFVCLALILSVADIPAVISGVDTNPVNATLEQAFGTPGARIVQGIVLISFLSCVTSLQAAASRLAYAYGRDDMIIGSKYLKVFSHARRVPPYALIVAALAPALIIVGSSVSADALTKIVSFAAFGIYLAFQMVVLAALRARIRGWVPSGTFTLGRWGLLINVGAIGYGVVALVNMCWPRTPGAPWYDNWIVALSGAVVVVSGVLYLWLRRPHAASDAPYSDAIPADRRTE
ncbi:APC family permease [Saccharopolyspora sp. ASAGF58]|uniref:APC family permease n=1 Tax=Saccharopolyspora sp. ASAGF58 TaxID=2719023 RepID=UPI001FF09542|nr:APC family permease [Saccharopolyspora sp. ASAGF58]